MNYLCMNYVCTFWCFLNDIIFRPKMWEIIEFWVIFVIENSTKFTKIGLEGEINWASNLHLGQQHMPHKFVNYAFWFNFIFKISIYNRYTTNINIWNVFLPTYILFNIWILWRSCTLPMMINSFYIWFSIIHHYLC